MKFTLEDIEKVMNQAGVDYKAAKEALLKASGDAEKAIKDLQPKVCELGEDVEKLANKVKETVKEGNVDRIQVKKGDEVSQGTTLFIIGDGNYELRYQISNEGTYIDPLEVIQIEG